MTLAAAVYHEIDSEPDLIIGAVGTATARNHARTGDAINATVVQRIHALADAASPGDLVAHLGRTCDTGGVTCHTSRIVDVLSRSARAGSHGITATATGFSLYTDG